VAEHRGFGGEVKAHEHEDDGEDQDE